MAEFNRTSLDIMDELYAPFKEAQAQKQGLERQAGGAALARELQLRDADTKRQQQLTDAATAHESGLERITHEYDERARIAEDTAARLKKDKLVERRDEAAFLWNKLDKAGVNTGFTITEINNATSGALAAMTAGMHLEVNTLTANKKTRTEILEKLKAFERTDAGKLALQTAIGKPDPIDWEAEGQQSKAYLDDLFGEVTTAVNLQKLVGTVGYEGYRRDKRIQHEALEDTGIMDFMVRSSGDDRVEAAKWLAKLPGFEEQLLQSIKDDWTPGDQRPDKLRTLMEHLDAGDLTQASAYLDREGEAGNQPLIEGITRWAAQDASEAQSRLQIQILSKQGALEKLTSVNRSLADYIQRHPEVEGQAVESFYTNEEWDAFQGRRRAQAVPLEPGDPGFKETAQAVSAADLNALVADEPDEKVEVAPVTPPVTPAPSPTELPMYDTGAAGIRASGFDPEKGVGKGILRGRLEQGVKRLTHTNPTILGGPSMSQELVDYLEKYAPMPVSVHSRSGTRPRWKVQSSLSPEQMGSILDKVREGQIPPPPDINIGQAMEVLAPVLQRFNTIQNTPTLETDPASGFRTTR